MLQSTFLQRLQVFFVGTTTVGVWLNLIYSHPDRFRGRDIYDDDE